MADIPVPRFLNSIDALVWLAAHPLPPPIAAALAGARRAELPAREPAPPPAPKVPTQPTPQAPPPAALFSPEYVADVYRRRQRAVLAAQAEVAVAATALAERRARGHA
jgi:hypothetical protein